MRSETWRKLAEALLNATLMLIAMILLLAVVLVVQLRGLGSDLRADLAGMQARSAEARGQAQAALTALEAAGAARGEGLTDDLARARDGVAAALDRLGRAPPAAMDGALWQRMLLAGVAAAAREAQAARAAP